MIGQWGADDHDRGPGPEFLNGKGKKTYFSYDERDPEALLRDYPASPTRARHADGTSNSLHFKEDARYAFEAQRNRFQKTLEMLKRISKYWVLVWHGDLVTLGFARTKQQRQRLGAFFNPLSFDDICAGYEGKTVRLDTLFEVAARARGVQEVLDRI